MKNLSLILNFVLLAAVAILFFLVLGNKKAVAHSATTLNGDSTVVEKMPIAYINIDSLLINYIFAKNANEELISKQESSTATLNSRARSLQNEMDEFNRKLENQAFLSRERAEQAQMAIMTKQQDLQKLEAQMAQQLMEQQQKMSEQLRDTIDNFLKSFNADGRYQMIISNTANDNVLFATEGYDITDEVVSELNKRFNKGKK